MSSGLTIVVILVCLLGGLTTVGIYRIDRWYRQEVKDLKTRRPR